MSLKFKTQTRLKFRDADPAQIMYFANIFSLSHDTFEEFIVEAGYRYEEWFSGAHHMIPIRHAEADYKSPLIPGQLYDITAEVASFGTTSFKMKYTFQQNGKLHATVHMVHSVLNPQIKAKMALPTLMLQRLSAYHEVPIEK
ncbi:MAG: acyl-CoA thioesterase [Bdellovibrionaceae bacterium]|nr:acyl-CoA thioesterase [Pseudobdellovibrionaceae bacterium]